MEPGAYIGCGSERLPGSYGREKRLLERVFRVFGRASDAVRYRVQPLCVLLYRPINTVGVDGTLPRGSPAPMLSRASETGPF